MGEKKPQDFKYFPFLYFLENTYFYQPCKCISLLNTVFYEGTKGIIKLSVSIMPLKVKHFKMHTENVLLNITLPCVIVYKTTQF